MALVHAFGLISLSPYFLVPFDRFEHIKVVFFENKGQFVVSFHFHCLHLATAVTCYMKLVSLSLMPVTCVFGRANLDPFDQYPDDRLWSILEKANLKKKVVKADQQLEMKVTPDGANFRYGGLLRRQGGIAPS